MSITLKIADADFSKSKMAIQSPNRGGLVGEWFLGGSLEESIKNRAGGQDMTPVGNPTFHEGYASGRGKVDIETHERYEDDNFDTNIDVSEESPLTMIAVAKSPDAKYGSLLRVDKGRTIGFDDIHSDIYYINSEVVSSTTFGKLPITDDLKNKWVMIAGSGSPTQSGRIFRWKNGVMEKAYNDGTVHVRQPLETLQVSPRNAGEVQWAYIAVYRRLLSEDELNEIYSGLNNILASRGVALY